MATTELRDRLQPALLDRLTDRAPHQRVESEHDSVMTKAELRQAVLRDTPYPGIDMGALVASFVVAAAGGPPPIVTADEVFQVLATCFAIDRAAASGEPVEVKPFD